MTKKKEEACFIQDCKKSTQPWYYAKQNDRDYLTPEDIGEAIRHGGTKEDVWKATLQAVDLGALEDASCCAFVALSMDRSPEKL